MSIEEIIRQTTSRDRPSDVDRNNINYIAQAIDIERTNMDLIDSDFYSKFLILAEEARDKIKKNGNPLEFIRELTQVGRSIL